MKSQGFAVAPGTCTLVAVERTQVFLYLKTNIQGGIF